MPEIRGLHIRNSAQQKAFIAVQVYFINTGSKSSPAVIDSTILGLLVQCYFAGIIF